ncbi:hypothetical protein AcV7_004438 [Taiwanofungus camphoratus]|nr:hypothetical protein AcV7_004438 [Antrodia cinnamomea]
MQLLHDVEKNELKLWKELKKELGDADYIGNEDINLFLGANSLEEDDGAVPEEIAQNLLKGFIQKKNSDMNYNTPTPTGYDQ